MRPSRRRYKIGAVNSINWARVAAQIVYYFKGYFAATASNDEQVAFCVPSGNFGNICAGHIARMMGLPIGRLVLATNENDVLDEFFRTGVYRPRKTSETHVTSSPSMDISKASNFERFAFDLVGRDPAVVRQLWSEVDGGGSFDLTGTPFIERLPDFGFVSGRSSHADRLATIRDVWQRYGVMIDTHTADAVKVAREHRDVRHANGGAGDRAAGEILGDHPGSAGPRSLASGGFRRHRKPAAACGGDGRRHRGRQGLHG